MTKRVLSTEQRVIAGTSIVATMLSGAASLFVLLALLPYGHPMPSAAVVIARFALAWVLLPLGLCLIAVSAGRACIAMGRTIRGTLILALPLIAAPAVFMSSLA